MAAVSSKLIDGKWRIIDDATGEPATFTRGKTKLRDGGGYSAKSRADAQVRAINDPRRVAMVEAAKRRGTHYA